MIKINGMDVDADGVNLQTYLEENGYLSQGWIAVELNEVIISRNDYADTVLHQGDVVEIVNFVGGG